MGVNGPVNDECALRNGTDDRHIGGRRESPAWSGQIACMPDALQQAAITVSGTASGLDGQVLEAADLANESVGHPELGAALREFGAEFGQRINHLRDHLRHNANLLQDMAVGYQATDGLVADAMSHRPDPGHEF